jgi:hypothetical protein
MTLSDDVFEPEELDKNAIHIMHEPVVPPGDDDIPLVSTVDSVPLANAVLNDGGPTMQRSVTLYNYPNFLIRWFFKAKTCRNYVTGI